MLPPAGPPMPPPIPGGGGAGAGAGAGGSAALAALGPIAAVVAVLVKSIQLMTHSFEIASARIVANAQRTTAEINNQFLQSQIINKQKNYETVAKVAEQGGKGGELVASLTRAIGENRVAPYKAFIQVDEAYRNRFGEIARYNSQLAQIKGMGEFKKVSRDIQEADILGDRLGKLAKQQQDFDLVQQQISIAKKTMQLTEQSADTQKGIESYQKQLTEALEKLPPEIAKKIREMSKKVASPLTDILKHAPVIPDDPGRKDMGDRNKLAVPILQGATAGPTL